MSSENAHRPRREAEVAGTSTGAPTLDTLRPLQRVEWTLFRCLQRVYGRSFRDRYGPELEEFFLRDRVRDRYAGFAGGLAFWRLTLADLGAAAARQRRVSARDRWRLEALWHDIASGVRQIRSHPTFSITAILILGLAIGANTAVFSVVNGIVLRPLPYPEPDELVHILTRFLPESGYEFDSFAPSLAEVAALADSSESMQHVAAFSRESVTLTADNESPTRLPALAIDEYLLPLLGVEPALGRWFHPDEVAPGGPGVAILSHSLWSGRFGQDPAVLGRTITLDGTPSEVVGVMPPGFDFPSTGEWVYVAARYDRADPGGWGWHGLSGIARLRDGVTLPQASDELVRLNDVWREEFGHPQPGHDVYLRELHTSLIGEARQALWMLMAAVLLVLTIGAVNVASLMLARGEVRAGEVWIRMALGAGRARIVRQLLTESLVLAALAATAGLALAGIVIDRLVGLESEALPRMEGVAIDTRVLGFTVLAAVLTALVFGLAPALQASRAGGVPDRRTTDNAARKRRRGTLVTVEVALSVVVVLCAGLVGRSFAELNRVDVGFETAGRLSFGVYLPETSYPEIAQVRTGILALRDELRALPGVTHVAFTSALPITGSQQFPDYYIQGRPDPAPGERRHSGQTIVVTAGYMQTMGIEVLAGRAFEATDGVDAAPVALVNRAAADIDWPGENPVGQFIRFDAEEAPWIEVVGVVDNVHMVHSAEEVEPQVYVPFEQQQGFWRATSRVGSFVVRTPGDPLALVPQARRALAEVDPRLPMQNIRTTGDLVHRSLAGPRLTSSLLGSFAGLALLLALVGVYGTVQHSVARRTREIGIRQALGADPQRVLWLMLREGARPALVGLMVGLGVALVVTDALSDLLYEISPRDPATFLAVAGAVAAVATVAAWLPSRRATRVTPVDALRAE